MSAVSYVLIIILSNIKGVNVIQQEFNRQERCEVVREQIVSAVKLPVKEGHGVVVISHGCYQK